MVGLAQPPRRRQEPSAIATLLGPRRFSWRGGQAVRGRHPARPAILGVTGAAAVLLSSQSGVAQEDSVRSWTATAWVQAGYQMPSGRMATAPSNLVEIPLANTVADMGASLVVGGGADIDFSDRDLGLRLGFETTVGAEASGRLGVCEVLGGGPLCEPETASATIRAITVQLRAYRGNPEWRIRPLVSGGVGLRQYALAVPDCTTRTSNDHRSVCRSIVDIFRESGSHVVFRATLGGRLKTGRYVSELTLSGDVGPYSGGTQRVNGNWYANVRIEASAGINVF